MIKSNKPLVVQFDARSGRALLAEVLITVTEVRLVVEESIYKVNVQDTILGTVAVSKSVDIPIATYEALKASIVQEHSFTETGSALDLKIIPYALLYFVKNDIREDGKLIYGADPADFEIVNTSN